MGIELIDGGTAMKMMLLATAAAAFLAMAAVSAFSSNDASAQGESYSSNPTCTFIRCPAGNCGDRPVKECQVLFRSELPEERTKMG